MFCFMRFQRGKAASIYYYYSQHSVHIAYSLELLQVVKQLLHIWFTYGIVYFQIGVTSILSIKSPIDVCLEKKTLTTIKKIIFKYCGKF